MIFRQNKINPCFVVNLGCLVSILGHNNEIISGVSLSRFLQVSISKSICRWLWLKMQLAVFSTGECSFCSDDLHSLYDLWWLFFFQLGNFAKYLSLAEREKFLFLAVAHLVFAGGCGNYHWEISGKFIFLGDCWFCC